MNNHTKHSARMLNFFLKSVKILQTLQTTYRLPSPKVFSTNLEKVPSSNIFCLDENYGFSLKNKGDFSSRHSNTFDIRISRPIELFRSSERKRATRLTFISIVFYHNLLDNNLPNISQQKTNYNCYMCPHNHIDSTKCNCFVSVF